MRLISLRIQNFRSFRDQTIDLGPYCCFVGPNGGGKSTILTALNVFFRTAPSASLGLWTLTEEDFHLRNTAEPVRITLTFDDLSNEAKEDFKDYVRQDQLVVTAEAVWNAPASNADVVQFGQRLGIASFASFFELLASDAKVPDLKDEYEKLRSQIPELRAPGTRQVMVDALRGYETSHSEAGQLLRSNDEFYGFTRGANRLAKHLQWVYVPAVKDAYTEQAEAKNTALGQLLGRTIRARVNFKTPLEDLKKEAAQRYLEVIEGQREALKEVSTSLERRLHEWAHGGAHLSLDWHYDPNKSITVNEPVARAIVGEDEFAGEIVRLGHGLQRAFIVTLLQELAGCDAPGGPRLLLGFEEPELYQHPPQARYLASLLAQLSSNNAQVILTTHSPYFVSTRQFAGLRMVRKHPHESDSLVTKGDPDKVTKLLATAMEREPWPTTSVMASVEAVLHPSQAELFFCSCAVLVEGSEDLAFITTQLALEGHLSELRRWGCHFVAAEGKPNLGRLIAVARVFDIPVLTVCDSDSKDTGNLDDHRRNNCCIQRLSGFDRPEPFPTETLWSDRLVMWPNKIDETVRQEVSEQQWSRAVEKTRAELGLVPNVSRKNGLLISAVVEALALAGLKSTSLARLSNMIVEFSSRTGTTARQG